MDWSSLNSIPFDEAFCFPRQRALINRILEIPKRRQVAILEALLQDVVAIVMRAHLGSRRRPIDGSSNFFEADAKDIRLTIPTSSICRGAEP